MTFDVDVPAAGSYDLSVLASAYNKDALNLAQGPVNMFVTVDGGAEQEIYAELGYKWVVWNHTDTKVDLKAGRTASRSRRRVSTERADRRHGHHRQDRPDPAQPRVHADL